MGVTLYTREYWYVKRTAGPSYYWTGSEWSSRKYLKQEYADKKSAFAVAARWFGGLSWRSFVVHVRVKAPSYGPCIVLGTVPAVPKHAEQLPWPQSAIKDMADRYSLQALRNCEAEWLRRNGWKPIQETHDFPPGNNPDRAEWIEPERPGWHVSGRTLDHVHAINSQRCEDRQNNRRGYDGR